MCDAGGSQARFLLSKLNPSTTHTSSSSYGGVSQTAQTIFTGMFPSVLSLSELELIKRCRRRRLIANVHGALDEAGSVWIELDVEGKSRLIGLNVYIEAKAHEALAERVSRNLFENAMVDNVSCVLKAMGTSL